MYWLTRSVITFQAEMTTITVMNAVSGMNQTEMPSTPRRYQTLKRAIQAWRLAELHRGAWRRRSR